MQDDKHVLPLAYGALSMFLLDKPSLYSYSLIKHPKLITKTLERLIYYYFSNLRKGLVEDLPAVFKGDSEYLGRTFPCDT